MITRHIFKNKITPFLIPILISGIILQGVLFNISHAASHITSDGTMGTTVTQAGNIYNIDGGTIKGANQFHSFGLFSVGTGDTASFNGPNYITNIIGRVTGGQQSVIDGILKSTITDANLYLLNPYGVLFGKNASLDVNGSFHISTADYLKLSDGGIFYSNPLSSNVLTTAAPAAFGFLSNNPAPITIQDSALAVPAGKTLSLVGGDIHISGGPTGGLYAQNGWINIASFNSPGEVVLDGSHETPDLKMDSFDKLGTIHLINLATVDVSSTSGNGTIVIRGGRLVIDNSFLAANTMGDTTGAKIGIDINLAEEMNVVNGSGIMTNSFGAGKAGDIQINSGSIYMSGVLQSPDFSSSIIESVAFGTGNCGDITIKTGPLELRNASALINGAWGAGIGDGGNVHVVSSSVLISGPESSPDPFFVDFTGICTGNNYLGGKGGNLNLLTPHLVMTNRGMIDGSSYGPGSGGEIEIITDYMEQLNGAEIIASAFGSGDGGLCKIVAGRLVISGVSPEIYTDIAGGQSLAPSGIASQTGLAGGSAGGVQIKAGRIEILDGGRLSVETFGPGNGGNIDVEADHLLISGANQDLLNLLLKNDVDPKYASAGIFSGSGSFYLGDDATGNGGHIRITAKDIQLRDRGLITSDTETPGIGGSIQLNADNIELSGEASIAAASRVAFATRTGNSGNVSIKAEDRFQMNSSFIGTSSEQAEGGAISIEAGQILLAGSIISAESSGEGNAGNISISARGTFSSKGSAITTETEKSDGGNIQVSTGYMVNLLESKITSSVRGGPQTTGGNITIDPQYVILNDSQIIANAYEGTGGNIQITAMVFLASPESVVDASSALGIDGTVDIRAPITNISGTLAPMQGNFLLSEALLRDRCMAKIRGEKYSSLIVSGRDGLPIRPGSVLPSPTY